MKKPIISFALILILFVSCNKVESPDEAFARTAREQMVENQEIERLSKEEQERIEAKKQASQEAERLEQEEQELFEHLEERTKEFERLRAIYLREKDMEEEKERSDFKAACVPGGVIHSRVEFEVMTDSSPRARIWKGTKLEIIRKLSNEERDGVKVQYYPEPNTPCGFFIDSAALSLERFCLLEDDFPHEKLASEEQMREAEREMGRVAQLHREAKEKVIEAKRSRKLNEEALLAKRSAASHSQGRIYNGPQLYWRADSNGNSWVSATPEQKRNMADALSRSSRNGNSAQFFEDALDEFYSDPSLRNTSIDDITRLLESASKAIPLSERNY